MSSLSSFELQAALARPGTFTTPGSSILTKTSRVWWNAGLSRHILHASHSAQKLKQSMQGSVLQKSAEDWKSEQNALICSETRYGFYSESQSQSPAFTSHLVGNQSHFLGWQTPSRADCVLCHRRPIHAFARLQKSMGTQGTSGRTDEWLFFGRASVLSLGTGHDTKQSMICIRDYGPAFPTCMNTSCHVMLCRISAVHILKSMQSRSFIGFRQEHLCCTCSAPCPHIVATFDLRWSLEFARTAQDKTWLSNYDLADNADKCW